MVIYSRDGDAKGLRIALDIHAYARKREQVLLPHNDGMQNEHCCNELRDEPARRQADSDLLRRGRTRWQDPMDA